MAIKLSVVIPTYNRRHVLEFTLPSIFAQDLPPEDYEVIIVSDGSTDGTDELLGNWKPKCAFHALEAPHRGPSGAHNVGIRAAVGDLVLLLDDDLIAGPDLFRQHCMAHSGSEPQVVHGPVYVSPNSAKTIIRHITEVYCEEQNRILTSEFELRYPDGAGPSIFLLASIRNSSMPRESLLRCGGYDEQIWAAVDLELGIRLWKMGLPLHCRPAAVAYEFHEKSSENYLRKQAKATGEGDLRASRKHPEYRPNSGLASFANTRAGKKWLRSALMRFPISPVPLLYLPLRLEKWFYEWTAVRELFVHLFRAAVRITWLRGALAAAGSWEQLRSEFDRRAPGLVYCGVGPARPGVVSERAVSPEQFERQIRWLSRRGYTGIRASDWLRWRREGTGLPEKPIIITFDDAYADIAEYALPILKQYGFSAVVFVVTGQLGGTDNGDEARGCGTLRLMSAEQIRYWAGQGIEFGAQGRTHADLTQLSTSELLAEVAGSKCDLSALLGSPVISFAYPYGAYNQVVQDVVHREFDLAFTKEEDVNYLRTDPYLLRRTAVGATDSLREFARHVRFEGLGTSGPRSFTSFCSQESES